MSPLIRSALAVLTLVAPVAPALSQTSTKPSAAKRTARDFRTVPPVAQRAGIRLLATAQEGSNAALYVEFAPGEPAPPVVTLQLERARLVLRDDGRAPDEKADDRVHSGYVRVDVEQLQRTQQAAARSRAFPIFAGRQLVANATIRGEETPETRSAADALRRVPVLPLRENPEGHRVSRSRALPTLTLPIAVRFRPGRFFPIFPVVDPADVKVASSLVITDPGVINDPGRTFNPCTNTGTPMGKWTFGHLMEQLANTGATGIPPPEFVDRWLRRWVFPQTVNDFAVSARNTSPGVTSKVIAPWLTASGGTSLDLGKAPFKLLAIVNRVDLRQNTVYGGGSAGEGRFVFALVDVASCTPQPMTVIFEYGIQKPSCSAVKAWAQQWQNLGSLLPVGSAAFNSALEAITVQFTEAGTNPSQLPNRSSLNQLRTNEIALASPWELREFRIAADDSDIGHLREVTVKQNPDDDLNLTPKLADYINANSASVLTDSHTVPIAFPSSASPFLGGSAPVPPSFWDGPPASLGTANLRHHFSLNTCNGCHSGETQAPFTHIHPAGGVSGFMTGIDVNDPAGEAVIRHFDDQLRRQVSMAQLLSQPCFFHVFFSPLRMVH